MCNHFRLNILKKYLYLPVGAVNHAAEQMALPPGQRPLPNPLPPVLLLDRDISSDTTLKKKKTHKKPPITNLKEI